MVDGRADVAYDACADGHHDAHRGEVAARFQQGGHDERQADEEQRGRGTIVGDELRRVIVEVVDDDVFERR